MKKFIDTERFYKILFNKFLEYRRDLLIMRSGYAKLNMPQIRTIPVTVFSERSLKRRAHKKMMHSQHQARINRRGFA